MKKLFSLVSGVFTGGVSWLPLLGAAAAAVAVAGLWAYIVYLQNDRDHWRTNAVVAIDAAKQNEQARLATLEHATSMVNAMAAERDAYAQRVKYLSAMREEIDNAPESDDGHVAPVLGRVIGQLHHQGSGAGGASGKAPGAGGAVDVPGHAGAARP